MISAVMLPSIDDINPKLLALISRAAMALGAPVVALLITDGVSLAGGPGTPVSFCNILLVANLCAAMVVGGRTGVRPIFNDLKQTTVRTRVLLLAMGASASFLSAFLFLALETTTVANAVILGRVGPVLYAVLAVVAINQSLRGPEWIGFTFIAAGVIAIAFTGSGFELNKGDVLVLLSCLFFATTNILTKMLSDHCALGTLVFVRNAVSAAVFFCVALYLFGPNHFTDVFAGDLWIVMAFYSVIVVVLSQVTWFSAIARLTPAEAAKWTVLSPVFGVAFAFLINQQVPSMLQLSALGLVSIGILITALKGGEARKPAASTGSAENSLAAHQ